MGNRLVFGACLGAALAVACGGSQKKAGGDAVGMESSTGVVQVPRVDKSLCDTAGKQVSAFDLNRDSRPDVWKLYDQVDEGGTTISVLTCKQVDLDHDGKKDYVITYNANGGKISENFDFDFDGKFDATHYYDQKSGDIYLVERDSDFDKQPDIWEKFDGAGTLESVRRDRNADGKPDVWEQYDKGTLIAILYDDDFDQRVDRKDEVERRQPPGAPASGEPIEDEPLDEDIEAETAEAGDEAG